ncbi:MAG: 50S ribosomal protein L17 [Oscillospiraceae bacterium]|nr:50S ribosomal protein L17 [Oscillospiraceae bacterium]
MPGTRKLGRVTSHRMSMLYGMVTQLLDAGKLTTTVTRAREVAPLAEKVITLAKKNDLAAYRAALAIVTREDVVKKLFTEAPDKFADRSGGYTRITRVGIRRGDAAETALLEIL